MDSFVRLTDEVRSEYAKTMAHIWTRVEELRAKKARDAKRTQEDIDEELDRIGAIARIINADGQPQDQLDLFATGRVTDDVAQQALAALSCRQPECSAQDARVCGIHGACSCLYDSGADGAFVDRSVDCALHGTNAPHITDPPAVELTEPQIVEATARECVEEWARLKVTPESVKDRNALVKAAIAAQRIPVHRRRAFGEAVRRLLSDEPSLPAGADASDEAEADGNVGEEAGA